MNQNYKLKPINKLKHNNENDGTIWATVCLTFMCINIAANIKVLSIMHAIKVNAGSPVINIPQADNLIIPIISRNQLGN